MVTWFGVGLDRGVTPRSQKGHLKVTERFKQLQIGENTLFLLVLLQFSSLEMSMGVETHQDPSMEIYQNTPRGYRVNIRAGGVIPHKITLMLPILIGQKWTKYLNDCHVWTNGQYFKYIGPMMNPNPITHGDMGWCSV